MSFTFTHATCHVGYASSAGWWFLAATQLMLINDTGMVMTITIFLIAASSAHWNKTTKGQQYRCLPLSHKRTANENKHEPIRDFPCIPQP
jgi:hypothetical protein